MLDFLCFFSLLLAVMVAEVRIAVRQLPAVTFQSRQDVAP